MKEHRKKRGIVFVRSTSIISDSRVIKEANTALRDYSNIFILGWNREKKVYIKSKLKLNNGIAGLKLFNLKSGYGNGMKSLPKLLFFQVWLLLQLFINKNKYAIIHSCDLDTAIPCFLISKLLNKKLVYDIFDYYIHSHDIPKKIEKLVEKIEIGIINKADWVIICSESRFKQLERSNPKRVEVIHNTPNLEFRKNYNNNIIINQNNKFKIAYIGILQDHRLLVEISEQIANYKNIELHIGGFGTLEFYFEKLSNETRNVLYYGQLTYSDVLQLESECDALFATYDPSVKNHQYSAPNKIYEAMALKKPIVVCNNTGIDEMVNRYNIGISINYKADEFFESILYLAENKNLQKSMGENGKKLFDESYKWMIMEKRLLDVYSKIYKGG